MDCDFEEWLEKLIENPELETEVPWESEEIGKFNEGMLVQKWLELIAVHPQFASRLDWSRAGACTDAEVWRKLLPEHVEYEKYCPWSAFKPIDWWVFFKYLPSYYEKCPCPKEVPVRAWAYLLCNRPELATQFDRWEAFSPPVWASLLKYQPELAEHCPCLEEAKACDVEWNDECLRFPTGNEMMDMLENMDYTMAKNQAIVDETEEMLAKLQEAVNRLENGLPGKQDEQTEKTEEVAAQATAPDVKRSGRGIVNQEALRLPAGYRSFRDAYISRFPVRENPIPPIKGGWGYTQEDAVVIDYETENSDELLFASMDCIDLENYFILFRIQEEAEHAHETKYAGCEWKKLNHQLVYGDDGRMFDRETVEARVFTLEDWEFLKNDWTSHNGYKGDKEGAARHEQMREERFIRFTEIFWFDVTNCL